MDNQQLSKECKNMKKLTLQEFQDRLNIIHPKEKLQALKYNGDKKSAIVKCLTCGTIYEKPNSGYFTDERKKSVCKICFPTQSNTFKQNYKCPDGYELVGKYLGMQKKTQVKCLKCGFIWSIKPNNLEFGKGCPKCNKKISKGEQKIIAWLEKNNIIFQSQYPIDIEGHHLLIDFYLPNQNLWIEYNGEQHYNPINFFGGEEKFQKQVYLDSLKQNYFKEKMLVISYLDFDNIESILESSTTIPKGSRN